MSTDRGPEILITCGVLVGISVLTVSFRCFVRLVKETAGWDDYSMAAATVIILAELIVIIFEVRFGAGRHIQDIKPKSHVVEGLFLNFVTQPLCLVALCLTKLSVGLFLRRLMIECHHFIMVVMTLTTLACIGNLLTVFFQCMPLSRIWDASIGGSCLPPENLRIAAFFNSSVSALTDLVFAVLPIPVLLKVQKPPKIKAALVVVLALGMVGAAAGLIKLSFLKDYGKHGDFLFDSADLTIWQVACATTLMLANSYARTTIEICTAINAASIPTLYPLVGWTLSGIEAIFNKASPTTQLRGYDRGYQRHSSGDDIEMQRPGGIHVSRTDSQKDGTLATVV